MTSFIKQINKEENKIIIAGDLNSQITFDDFVENYLNNWLSGYVLLSANATQGEKARFPLAEGRVDVTEIAGKPGAYSATVFLKPHFQMEELSTSIRLVAELPTETV